MLVLYSKFGGFRRRTSDLRKAFAQFIWKGWNCLLIITVFCTFRMTRMGRGVQNWTKNFLPPELKCIQKNRQRRKYGRGFKLSKHRTTPHLH
jgi:hypothetical protein